LWRSAENLTAEPFDLWHSAVKFTTELAFRSILASGGWHSAVHLRAVCQDVIPVVAIRGQMTAELGKLPNSSTRHFSSRVPLFEASYLFAVRLLEYKIPTRRIV
jgi:hypothetical protein